MVAGWFATKELQPGLWVTTEPAVHPFFSANLYTVRGRDADLQVDFGCGVAPLRPALPLTPGKPVIAVATHAHVDHIGGFHEFPDRRGHLAEAECFATVAPGLTFQDWFREERAGPSLSALPHPGFTLSDWALAPAPLTATLADGERIDLGDRAFTILHLPGHSPGSIGLFDERDGLLLTGDAIYDDELVDDIAGADIAAYRATMRRLAAFDCRLALGGHGPPFDGARLRQIAADYLARRDPRG
ncbi:MBL fold metallo-hydrolase [Frigidibacter sp. SD6-1]|uniref:MBL fold metallo-hydrolase n=1 Tax=Frigidibacter sp. SD6-1 TaxID=3032581 RepID=UPI0024DF82F0|nr:MBL fold metallo-hydrolase [Frigidibacter sp. SD6-1]